MDTYTDKIKEIKEAKELSEVIEEALKGRTDLMLQLGSYFSELYEEQKMMDKEGLVPRKALLSAVHWLECWYKGTDRKKHDLSYLLDLSRLYESLGMNRKSLELLLSINADIAIYTEQNDSGNYSEADNLNYVNYALGTMYMNGIGCERNHKKAFGYFESTDYLGSHMRAEARYNMARLCVKMNAVLDAAFYANTAKAIGHPDLDGILDKESIASIYKDSNILASNWMNDNYPIIA